MKNNIILAALLLTSPLTFSQETTVINGLDFGPLAKLVANGKVLKRVV